MSTKQLAIIIPAYKGDFFEEAIASIAGQTCKDFTLYVGNDAGSQEIDKAVEKYKNDIDIVYKRFEENLGGKDLVAEWNRVLSLIGEEPYFMFFSDDDVMEPDCILRFYEELAKNPDYDVYHFNLTIINSKSEVIVKRQGFPKVMSVMQFYIENNLYGNIDVRMPEFIFRTTKFKENGGFVSFPLAFRSDNATVIRVGIDTGIYTIEGPRVKWRSSWSHAGRLIGESVEKQLKFIEADIQYHNWIYKRLFPAFPKSIRWRQRRVTLSGFASLQYDISVKQRIKLALRCEDIHRHAYLTLLLPPWMVYKKVKNAICKPKMEYY